MLAHLVRFLQGAGSGKTARRPRPGRRMSLEFLESRQLLSGPEITILDGFASIESGTAAAINLGTVARFDDPPTRTFTVRNDGNSTLQLSILSVPPGFSLVEPPATSIVARGSDTFIVQLDASTPGSRAGQIVIATNDADESYFTFPISGTVTPNGPEIAILLGDSPILPGTNAATPWPGVVVGDTGPTRTFTIKNEGNKTLLMAGMTHPAGFALVGTLPASVAPQSSASFTMRLLSGSAGMKSGNIQIHSNDPDIAAYSFPVSGLVTTTAVPRMTVLYGSTVLASADSTVDFGRVLENQTGPSRTFTVRNDGTAPLAIDTLQLPDGFVLIEGLSPTLNPAETDTFLVQMSTANVAFREGNVTIDGNDPLTSRFVLPIVGSVVPNAPEIRVFQESTEIVSGSGEPFEFDSVLQGKPGPVVAFSIANFGMKDLRLGSITLPAGFKLVAAPPATLPPETFSILLVQLDSKVSGTKTGEITIVTNDSDENPFRISVTGIVNAAAPEITVTQQGKKVTDGSTAPIVFSTARLGQAGPTITFTVRNQGKGTLSLGTPAVPAGFTVIEGLSGTLAPGASDTFTVQLDTSTLGEFGGQIQIENNDPDESPFNFWVQGRVSLEPARQIVVQQGAAVLVSGESTVLDLGSVVFRKKGPALSLTIRNDGEGDLNLMTVELPSGFVVKKPPRRIAPQRAVTLQVRVNSRAIGSHSGLLVIRSDGSTDPLFVASIRGTVLG